MEALQRSAVAAAAGSPLVERGSPLAERDLPLPEARAPLVREKAQLPPLAEVEAFLARAKPSCTLYVYPHSEHVSQIYAGFYALRESGSITVRQAYDPAELRRRLAGTAIDRRSFDESLHGLLVGIDGAGLVFFDVRDGGGYRREILDEVAVYAK